MFRVDGDLFVPTKINLIKQILYNKNVARMIKACHISKMSMHVLLFFFFDTWDGMGWDGMGWDGMGWDGMGWDGMGWDAPIDS